MQANPSDSADPDLSFVRSPAVLTCAKSPPSAARNVVRTSAALIVKSALLAAPFCLFISLLAACGSGFDFRLSIAINAPPPVAHGQVIILSGVAALPSGSVRSGGTSIQPIVTCRPGTFSMFWANDANGTRGEISAAWDCPADRLDWNSSPIPLAPGDNRITVTMVDAAGSAGDVVMVRRE